MLKDSKHRILLILLGGALFLFFFGSGQAYRSDEVWSLQTVSLPYADMMEEIKNDIHPPLYYWMLGAWTRLAGEGEIAVRSLSILLMLGAGVVIYFGGRRHLGERGGLVAAALFIASPLSGVAAQMVRMYGLLALVSAISTTAYLRISAGDAQKRDWVLYIAANIAGSFTHVWFFFLLLAQACAYLAFRRTKGLGRMIAAAAVSLVPYAVLWMPVLLRQVQKTQGALAWVQRPGFTEAGETAFLLGGLFLLTIPFLRSWWKQPSHGYATAAEPALIALVAVVAPFLLSQIKPVFSARFTIVALPALCLAIAAFAPAIKKHYFETGLVTAAAVLALIVSQYGSRCDSRSTARYLARVTQTGDVVVFTNLSRLPIDYYWDRIQPDRRVREQSFPAEIDTHPGFVGTLSTEEARGKLGEEASLLTTEFKGGQTSRVFLLHGFRPAEDAPLKALLDAQFKPVASVSMECASMGSYFQYLTAYSCAPDVPLGLAAGR